LLKLYKDGKHTKTHEQVEKETQKTKFSKKLTTKVERKIDEVTPVVDAEKFIPESWLLTFLRLYARMSSYDIEKHGNLHK
jgi:Flp pilus assembly CpaF family ATPase